MKKSKFTILLLFLVMILAISAASAADLDDTSDSVVQAVDEAAVDEVASADVDDVVSTDSGADVIADPGDGNNFTSLKYKIDNRPTSNVVTLDKDYKRVDGDSDISIDGPVTIVGNNYKIDADGLGGIFNINTGGALTLMGVTLVNGKSDNGGAIYNEGTLLITGSTLSDNIATANGGAIYNKGAVEFNDHLIFTNNHAACGGAIYTENNLKITNAEFNNNIASQTGVADTGYGGAILTTADTTVTIKDSSFTGNAAFQGGAIYSYGVLDIDNTVFANSNKVTGTAISQTWASGGAICTENSFTIKNTNFTDNYAAENGAAIYSWVNSDNDCTASVIDNCRFEDNYAETYYGAIYFYHKGKTQDLVINNSHFIKNSANIIGGILSYAGDLTVENTEFTDNEARTSYMGAIYYAGTDNTKISVKNSNFTGNTAATYTGALHIQGGSAEISGSRFVNNSGESTGAVYFNGVSASITDSYFENNKANGKLNAITLGNGNLALSENTIAGDEPQILVKSGKVTSQINVTILNNGTIDDNYAAEVPVNATITDDMGNLIADAKGFKFVVDGAEAVATYDAVNKIYTGSLALPGPGIYTVNITYTEQDKLKVKTATINNYRGTFRDLNKTIANGQDLQYDFKYTPELGDTLDTITIPNGFTCEGNGFTIDANGASINIFTLEAGKTATLKNMVITGVNMSSTASYGAVVNHGTLTIDNCTFKDNAINKVSNSNGGAAVFNNGAALTIISSKFINNTAPWSSSTGAVSSWSASGLLIKDSYFEANVARFGGAVEIEDLNQQSVAIQNCTFYNNTGYQGGALDINAGAKYVNVTGCTFDGNSFHGPAGDPTTGAAGAAICAGYNSIMTVEISNSIIKNNYGDDSVPSSGAGIRLTTAVSGIIKNCTFENNYGANYSAISAGTIVDLPFTVSLTVDNCTFSNNNAPNGITVFSNKDVVSTIENCDFSADNEDIAIATRGALSLKNNTVSTTSAKIMTIEMGTITSNVIIKVLNDGTAYHFANITLQANVTDDNHNPMILADLNLTVNDTANTQVKVTYNPATGLHEGTYTPIEVGKFNIGVNYITTGQLDITTANITIAKSLIDIQDMIDAASAGDIINLTGDYAYIPEFDSSIVNGIKVNKAITIDGKGYTISGSNAARIFDVVTGGDLTLINVTLTEGKGTFYNGGYSGGAIRMGLNTNLTVKDSKFVNNTVDFGGAIYSTADNVTINITDSEFINNTANYMVGAIMVSGDNTNVTITGSNFTANKGIMFGEAGAIYVQDVNSFKVDNCNFINNTADQGAAIDIVKYADSDFEVVITNSNFTDNSAKAVSNYKNGNVTIEDSTFTNNGGATDYAISNSGTLSLSGNKIDNLIYSSGKIASTIKVEVLDGEVKTINTLEANLYAKVTDDKGNLIKDTNFKFTINYEEVPAVYNATSKLYETTYPLPTPGIYPVNITYVTTNKLEVKNATIKSIKGTFTDLKEKLAVAGDVVLPYNFTYTPIIDGDNFPTILINKVIDGNGFTIDANGASINIFTVDIGNTATLKNMVITGVNMSSTVKYGAVINKGSLTVDNVTFIDNKINRVNGNDTGVAIWNNGNSLTVIGSKFINNTSPYNFEATSGQTIRSSVGAIHSIASSGVSIRDSYFERNIGRWGAAITFENFNQASAAVENCTFYNNTAYQGGAININWGCGVVNVTNCTFDSNSYIGPNGDNTHGANGGAISSGYGTLLLSDSIFKNNKGDDSYISSGAAVSFSDGAGGQIINCTFENNVDLNGAAAIDVGDVNGAAASVTIKDSRFINNIANGKSPVHINKGVTSEVENCTFEGTQSTYDIYNEGTLTLTKNTLPKGVYSNGTVKSPVINATLIGGKNITAALYDEVYPSATLTDDKGNAIYDPNFNITVDGVALKTDYDKETGLYNATYFIESAGDKLVNTTYTTVGLVITTGTYKVDKANVTEFTVVVGGETARILFGENATVEITLLGVNGEKLNVTDMVVVVNNTPYLVNITNGTGSFNVSGLLPGDYAALANFAGDGNYNAKYDTGVFTVLSPDLGIKVSIEDITYLDYPLINVTVGDDTFSGFITVTIDDKEYTIPVILGEGSLLALDVFDAGLHTYNATFAGDKTYAPNQTSNKEFKVSPRKVYVDVDTDSGVDYQGIGRICVLLEDENGDPVLDIIELILKDSNGAEVGRMYVETTERFHDRGEVWNDMLFTTKLPIGNYTVTFNSSNFVFEKMEEIYEFSSYGDEGKTNPYGTGTARVNDRQSWIEVEVLTNSIEGFEGNIYYINGNDVGTKTIYQLYEYDEDTDAMNPTGIFVEVTKMDVPVEFEYSVHKVYIEDVKVTEGEGEYVYNTEHNVTIELNGPEKYTFISYGDEGKTIKYGAGLVEITDEDGDWIQVKVLLNDFDDSFIGKYYYVNASETKDVYELYEYDFDADTMNATGIFVEISKVEINCNAVIEIGIADEDGKFNYSDSIDAKFEDGKLTVDLSSLKPGDYRLRLSLVDDTYEVVSWDDEYIVPYKELSSEDDYCLFRVQEVNVYLENVNGTQWTEYGENRTFNFELWCSYWLNGKEIEEAFIYSTTANVTVYAVERDDDGNIVSLTKVYSNETVAITDGTIEGIDLSNLNASEYKVTVALIDPYYQLSGWDEGQDVDYFAEYFNVDRTGVEVNVTVDQPITYGENATVTITITTPTGEKLNETVEVFGLPDIDKVTLVNGTITFDASGLNAGEHTIWVNFNGTDNFRDVYNTIEVFNVDKAVPTFEINDTSAEWNIPVDIPIKLIGANGEPITGTVIVKVDWGFDGIEKVVRLDENGTGVATFTIDALGDLTITATFDGNDNYYGATGTATLTVNDSTEAKMDVSAPSEIVYNETLNISVNLTNGRGAAIAGATVNYTVDGGEVQTATTADNGTVIIPIKDLARGEHTIVVLFDNASYVNQPSETITVDVKAAPSSVVIDDIASATYPGDVTITYAVINETDVTIVVKDADGNEITSGVDTSVDGTVTISGLNAGEYSITITNADKGNYSGSSDSKTFKVLKNASITTIEFTITGDKLVGSPLNITFTLPTDINPNNVTAFIDGHPYIDLTVNETTGVYTAVYDGFAVATGYTFRVEVDDPNYEIISDEISFVIDKVTPEIIISDIAGNAGDTVTATVTIAGGDATGYVLLDGVSYKVENGQATISVPITMAGMQNITVVYTGDDKYYNATKSKEFNAGKGVPTIKVEAIAAKDVYPGAVTVIVTSDVDGTYNITVDGVTKPVTVANGVGQESFSNVSAGTQNATVTFLGDVNYNVTTAEKEFTINKADPTGVCEVKVTRYPDDVVITIEGTDGVYNASVDAEHFVKITVVGGNGTGNISGLAAGAYNLTVNYIENNNYNPIEFKFEFVVDKDYSYVELTPVSETVTYPGAVNITFTYKNGEPKFNVTDANGNDVSFTIVDKKIVLTGLAAGTYTVEALIKATENYTADYDVITFDVEKAAVVIEPKATGEFIVDGKVNVTFKLPTDVTGTITVKVDNVDQVIPTPVEGVYTFEFNAFKAGSHTFVVSLTGDANYTDAMGQTSFDVAKIDPTISIAPDNSLPNPENISIKVAGDATGSIFVKIPGYLTLQQYDLENGAYTLQLIDIPADDYEIFVTYMGDAKYNNASANATFTIVKLTPEIKVNITDTEIVGQKDVVVNITMGDNFAYGNVTIFIDDVPYQTVDLDKDYANVTVTIPALVNGTHIIGVQYNGNIFYNASDVVNNTVTVTKAPSTVTIEPVGNVTYGSEVVIKYEITNRTDKVNITVVDEAGKDYKDVVIIEDSVITIKDVIPAGTYTVTIINGENGFYTESQANITFNVTKGPEIDINVVENTTTPTFTITLPEDAKGNLLVDIDGNHYYAPVVNGTASVTVPALVAGEYTANITYTGDGKYPEISKTTNVSVPSNLPENAISIPTSTSNLNPTFGVNLPSDAGGYIEVDVDGKKYYAGVENGKASVSLPGLATGQHKVTVTYSGDGKYTKISKSATVTLTDPVPGLSGNKNVNVIYSASATYKVRVTLDGKAAAGQTVVIKFNGKTYNVQSDANGYATLKLNTKVKPKTYTITATYKGITVKNKVKVKHILKVKNKVVKKSKKVTKVKITFKKISKTTSKKSKAKTKVIKIKFRGKTYKVKTKSRVATWKVKKSMVKKLKVGKKYKYRVTYGKDVITKKLTIKR